ncbi:MAG: RraA family protein [Candidatus Pacearchaeota archaeon]|jgi:regulator of RNase E activity RraA
MEEIKEKLSTALLSDIMDELGFKNQMLPIEIKPNFNEAKIFGKARIMKLKEITKDEDYSDVYKGLYFLESLNKGDILVVANAFDAYAFFGELMSTLAKSKGVEGTIVDGCTRDKMETIKLKYPVFAKNNIARDIKKRGIVGEVDANSTKIGDAVIKMGDYLFGDIDGVIVIPFEIKENVIKKALKIYDLEEDIKESITKGVKVEDLLDKFGEF